MRKLGLDVGTKKIGIAVTDPTNTVAQPLTIINRTTLKEEAVKIRSLVSEYEVGEVIAGLPVDLRGKKGIAARKIDDYLQKLEGALNLKIKRFDERFTTAIAEDMLVLAGLKRKKRKKIIDQLAATVILQNYLEHEKNN